MNASAPSMPTTSIAQSAYLGHADRPVRIETWHGRPVAVKRYVDRRAGEEAWEAMTALWRSSFGATRMTTGRTTTGRTTTGRTTTGRTTTGRTTTGRTTTGRTTTGRTTTGRTTAGLPEPLHFDAATGDVVMELLDGPALAVRGDLGRSRELAFDAAALAADLHGCGVVPTRHRGAVALARAASRKASERAAEVTGPRYANVVRLLADLAPRIGEGVSLVACHGDFSPRNLHATPTGVRMIDFDRLQAADPLRDVAYWAAWLWVTDAERSNGAVTDGETRWSIADSFTDAYSAYGGTDVAMYPSRYAWMRAVALVRIAHGWSALQANPDLVGVILDEAESLLQCC
jgi:hypothetical protein